MFENDDKDEFFFRWQIKNFSYAANKTGDAIDSPSFLTEVLDDTKWYLSLYPRGREDPEFIDIYVTRCIEDEGDVVIPIIFTIELEAVDSTRHGRRVSPKTEFKNNRSFGFEQYIRRETLLEDMKSIFLPDDILTIHCTLAKAESDVEYIKEYIAKTYAETVQIGFPWIIKNWSEIRDFSEVYKDMEFTGDHEASFRLFLCENDDVEKSLILKMKLLAAKKTTVYSTCRINVLDKDGSEAMTQTTHFHFSHASEMISRALWLRKDIKDSYLQDGALNLQCVLMMETGKKLSELKEEFHESEKDEDLDAYILEELVRDYEKLFLSGEFSNVKLRVGHKVVDCHKSILYARSPVMSDLLDKAEKASEGDDDCLIDIDDLDGDTLEQMIYFMYTDKINNIKLGNALKLFMAGHKYQIKYLKQKCALYLSQIFDFENVYDILIAAHNYEDGDLKRQAISYISEYFSRICCTTEWANFRKTEKELAAEVCREIRRIKHL